MVKKGTFPSFLKLFSFSPITVLLLYLSPGFERFYETRISSEREQFIDSLFVNRASRPVFFFS